MIATLNYHGVCIPKLRALTTQERMVLAFKKLNGGGFVGYSYVRPGTDVPVRMDYNVPYETHKVIGYSSFEDYHTQYPDCCQVRWYGPKENPYWPEPDLFQRISGDYGFGVFIEYRSLRERPDGSRYNIRSVTLRYFTNCGSDSPPYLNGG